MSEEQIIEIQDAYAEGQRVMAAMNAEKRKLNQARDQLNWPAPAVQHTRPIARQLGSVVANKMFELSSKK